MLQTPILMLNLYIAMYANHASCYWFVTMCCQSYFGQLLQQLFSVNTSPSYNDIQYLLFKYEKRINGDI